MPKSNNQTAFLARMNAQSLTAEDLERILQTADEGLETAIRAGDPGAMIAAVCSATIETLGPGMTVDRGMAAQFRLSGALSILRESRGWSLPLDQEFILVRREVLEVAATLPLVEQGDAVTFEKQAFLDAALRVLEPEGMA